MTGTNAMYMWGGGGVGGDIRERWVATDPVSPLVQPHEPKLPTHHFNSVMWPAPIWGRLAATPCAVRVPRVHTYESGWVRSGHQMSVAFIELIMYIRLCVPCFFFWSH